MNRNHNQDQQRPDPRDERLDSLFAAARREPVDTARAELGFETRLMARLRSEKEAASVWFAWTWRLAPVFAAIVLVLAVSEWLSPSVTPDEWEIAFTYGIEEPVLLPVDLAN